MNLKFRKSIVLGSIVLLMLVSFPTTNCSIFKSIEDVEPLDDRPKINVTLPDAHLYYNALKFRYADIEFNDTETIIDINLSGITSDEVLLGFEQKVYLHIQKQIIPTWIIWSSYLTHDDDNIGGMAFGTVVGIIDNWQINATHKWHNWNVSHQGILLINVGLTGIPPWLPIMHWFHFIFDLGYLMGSHPIPLLKLFGGIATYQANIHT